MDIFVSAGEWFSRGGPCMWPLLLCSFFVVAITVERILYYREAVTPASFIQQLALAIRENREKEALDMAKNTPGLAAAVAAEGLSILGSRGAGSMINASADRAVEKLKRNMNFLSLVIGLSPMLGLLGTVTGMMSAFGAMSEKVSQMAGITAGLAEALITTVFGLIIAIAGMCCYAYIHWREREAEIGIDEVADLLTGLPGEKEGTGDEKNQSQNA
jgi:biopolymer transport protein ExbB